MSETRQAQTLDVSMQEQTGKPAREKRYAGRLSMYTMAPLHVWARLLWEHGFPQRGYRARLFRTLVVSSLFSPFRLLERPLYMARVPPLAHPPIFVLGHWRSGTTHLHNLMTCDPGLGWVTRALAFAVACSCTLPFWLAMLRPLRGPNRQRPQDHVKIFPEAPAEEEHAMAVMSHCCFLHWYSFPQDAQYLWHRYATLDALSPRELAHWERRYVEVLRKASWRAGGRRLVLKSPINMGRIPHLLRLFPEARFIHIVRNPHTLYPSLMKFHRVTLENNRMTECESDRMRREAEDRYVDIMKKYLQDRDLIASDRLVEVRYEDLEQDPLPQLERIYAHLDLPGLERGGRARARVAAYAESLKGYQKNAYPPDPDIAARVRQRWGFALEAWGYDLP